MSTIAYNRVQMEQLGSPGSRLYRNIARQRAENATRIVALASGNSGASLNGSSLSIGGPLDEWGNVKAVCGNGTACNETTILPSDAPPGGLKALLTFNLTQHNITLGPNETVAERLGLGDRRPAIPLKGIVDGHLDGDRRDPFVPRSALATANPNGLAERMAADFEADWRAKQMETARVRGADLYNMNASQATALAYGHATKGIRQPPPPLPPKKCQIAGEWVDCPKGELTADELQAQQDDIKKKAIDKENEGPAFSGSGMEAMVSAGNGTNGTNGTSGAGAMSMGARMWKEIWKRKEGPKKDAGTAEIDSFYNGRRRRR